jgi:hypothetical protein
VRFDESANFTNNTIVAEIEKLAMCIDALFDNVVNCNRVVDWQERGMNKLRQSDRRFVDGPKEMRVNHSALAITARIITF